MSSTTSSIAPPATLTSPSHIQARIKEVITEIAELNSSHLSIHPFLCTPVLQIPQSKLFIIPPTIGTPFKLIIPDTHNLLLYPHPGPFPSTPAHTLTFVSDPTIAFPPDKSVSYYARLVLNPIYEVRVSDLQLELHQLQEQLDESILRTLHAFVGEPIERVALRTQFGNHVPVVSLPAFFLRAFAALGNLLGPDHLKSARDLVNIFEVDRYDILIFPGNNNPTFANGCEAFFSRILPSKSPLYTEDIMIPTNDPIRLALLSIAAALADPEREERANTAAVDNEFAFRELFKVYVNSPCIVWDFVESWSPSFAWQIETGKMHKYLVNAPTFIDSKLLLPVNVMQGSNTIIDIGLSPQGLTYLYSISDISSFLARQPSSVDTLFAAGNFGADWDRVNRPENLSRMRNTASYKMGTSGGSLYKGVYIDSPNAVADIVMYGKVGDVKLVDLSSADAFKSESLRELRASIDAARSHTKVDAKTFKVTFGSIISDVRRKICMTVATHGLVFGTSDGYKWIGVDDNGYMSLKKAVPFDGEPQEMIIPLPNSVPQTPRLEGSQDLPAWMMRQDMTFLVQNGESVKLESTSAIQNVAGEEYAGILAILACVRFRRITLDASFSQVLITERTPVSWTTEENGMFTTRSVKVDSAMKYGNLFALEDNVVVDHDGQGWICGLDYLRGRDGAPGRLMVAETEGCAPTSIVETDFSVPDTLLVAP